MYSHILWDFNGTLLDDIGIGIESINVLLAERKLPLLESREAYRAVFRFPIVEYYADLGLDVREYDALAVLWVKEYLSRIDRAPLQPEAETLLAQIAQSSMEQIILSATEQDQLIAQVESLGIGRYFNGILGLDNIYAASKTERALRWKEACKPRRVLVIGDTDHDARTAQAIGADCILVANGHQSRERLAVFGFPIVDSLAEVGDLIFKEQEAMTL